MRGPGAVLFLSLPFVVASCRAGYEQWSPRADEAPGGAAGSGFGGEPPVGTGGGQTGGGPSGGFGGEMGTGGELGTGGEPPVIPEDWWEPDFRTRIELSVESQGLTAPLTDFPVLVTLAGGSFEPDKAGSGGAALRFVAADHETELSYEVEQFELAGQAQIWVKVPLIAPSDTPTRFFLYYDNADAAPGENAAAVWSAGYLAVYHLSESVEDSSSSAHHGSADGAAPGAGQIAAGFAFDGVDDSIVVGTPAALSGLFVGGGTLSLFAHAETAGASEYPRLVDKSTGVFGEEGWVLQLDSAAGSLRFEHGFATAGGGWETPDASFGFGMTHGVALTFDALSPGTLPVIYIDGLAEVVVNDEIAEGVPSDDTNSELHFGDFSGNGRPWDGFLDEVRFSEVIRSPEWLLLEHQCASTGCVSLGASETLD